MMYDDDYLDFSLCDPSPLNYEHSFLPNEPHWLTSAESVGTMSDSFSRLNVLEPEYQLSTSLPSLDDSTVWVDDLVGSSGFFSPPTFEVIPDIPQPIDDQFPAEDAFSANLERYMQWTGEVPHASILTTEYNDFDATMYPNNGDLSGDPAEIPFTPVQERQVAQLSDPIMRLFSHSSSSITSSYASDYANSPPRTRTATRNEATNPYCAARITAFDTAVVWDEQKDEPLTEKPKGWKTYNSFYAPDDLAAIASFAPRHNLNGPGDFSLPMIASSPVGPPLSSPSDSSVLDTSPLPEAVMDKKRKLKELENDEDSDFEFTAVKQKRKRRPVTSEWEPVNEFFSRRKTYRNRSQFRCTLCLEKNKLHLCNSEGDMKRHLQSKNHSERLFHCPECPKSFTRQDALKRHFSRICSA